MSEVAAGETKPVRPWSMRRGRQEGASSNQLLGTEGAPLGVDAAEDGNGGAKVDHGSGGAVLPRRSKTLPVWPFPTTGRAGGFIPWSYIARYAWRAGRG